MWESCGVGALGLKGGWESGAIDGDGEKEMRGYGCFFVCACRSHGVAKTRGGVYRIYMGGLYCWCIGDERWLGAWDSGCGRRGRREGGVWYSTVAAHPTSLAET